MIDALATYDAVIGDAAAGADPEVTMLFRDRSRHPLRVRDWCADRVDGDTALLDRCAGPTLDVGCGPGRLVARLLGRGLTALGIDVSSESVRQTRARGAIALRRNVFDPLPAEGRWRHVLLADGNVGIGGDPVVLLRRCRDLMASGGSVVVELMPHDLASRRGDARLLTATGPSPWFPWAQVSVSDVHDLAADSRLTVHAVGSAAGRWFADLGR